MNEEYESKYTPKMDAALNKELKKLHKSDTQVVIATKLSKNPEQELGIVCMSGWKHQLN